MLGSWETMSWIALLAVESASRQLQAARAPKQLLRLLSQEMRVLAEGKVHVAQSAPPWARRPVTRCTRVYTTTAS